ncbi:hypothetical protein BJY04DRAFT_208045 [Aspergillus karnatakaensis]|uniref:uncharacterized protein n=1 Tax=Aspergillus karnatakaensis TaxID=1810916 RepID=UPI003CCD86B3
MRLLHNLVTGIALVGNTVLATVELGQIENGAGKALTNIAWIGGDNPCNTGRYIEINSAGQNPCGIHFTLSNGYRYYEENCGVSDIDLHNEDGSLNSHCGKHSWICKITDSRWIRQTWRCY